MARPDGPPPPPAEYGPAAYSYTWAVKDDYTSNNYGQNEDRNGFVYILLYFFLILATYVLCNCLFTFSGLQSRDHIT